MAESAAGKPVVGYEFTDKTIRVTINDRLFTEYHYKDVPRPYFYPVIGPTGEPLTRGWPMENKPNEAHDHKHHRSLWFAHGSINGIDFWTEGDGKGRTVHRRFVEGPERKLQSGVMSENDWVGPDGKIFCRDTRCFNVVPLANNEWYLDFDITLKATEGPVTFGDTKEGSMAIRVRPELRLKGEVAKGHLFNSEGQTDGDCWGKRAAWVDYYGPVDGKVVGITMFENPSNPRHPTWWHARDYGLFAANPFGVHDFESKPAGTGDLTLQKDEELTLRYRIYFHNDHLSQEVLQKRFEEYKNPPPSEAATMQSK